MYLMTKSKQAEKDYDTAVRAGHRAWLAEIFSVIRKNPYEPTSGHHFERLTGNLKGYCSRQIDYHNRVIYTVLPNTECARDKDGNLYDGIVHINRAWGHIYKKSKR